MPSQPAVDPFDELKKALHDRLLVAGMVHLAPMADMYALAFGDAARLREIATKEPFQTLRSGRKLEHPAWVTVDRLVRTALALAKVLELHRPIEPADDPSPWDAPDGLGPPHPKQIKRK